MQYNSVWTFWTKSDDGTNFLIIAGDDISNIPFGIFGTVRNTMAAEMFRFKRKSQGLQLDKCIFPASYTDEGF